MKLIDADELHNLFIMHYKKGGKHRETYLDCAFLTELQDEVDAIPIEWLLSKKYEIVTDTEAFPVNYVIDKVVDLWRKENGSK